MSRAVFLALRVGMAFYSRSSSRRIEEQKIVRRECDKTVMLYILQRLVCVGIIINTRGLPTHLPRIVTSVSVPNRIFCENIQEPIGSGTSCNLAHLSTAVLFTPVVSIKLEMWYIGANLCYTRPPIFVYLLPLLKQSTYVIIQHLRIINQLPRILYTRSTLTR